MWVNQWTSWQYDLDAETFNPLEEVLVTTLTLTLTLAVTLTHL